MKILTILLLLLPVLANADKLIIGGLSKHFEALTYIPNEKHQAIGYERDGLEIAYYRNSINKNSLSVSKIDRLWKLDNGFSVGYKFGIANGYTGSIMPDADKDGTPEPVDANKYGLMPLAQFIISHESKYFTVDLGLAPVSTLIFKVNI